MFRFLLPLKYGKRLSILKGIHPGIVLERELAKRKLGLEEGFLKGGMIMNNLMLNTDAPFEGIQFFNGHHENDVVKVELIIAA